LIHGGDPFVGARIRQSVKAQNRIGGSQERHECGSAVLPEHTEADLLISVKAQKEPYRL
jgi:hypothetical protein